MTPDINSLAHTRWNCKYHIVFAPKYRRRYFYKDKKAEVGKILRQLCEWKEVKIEEAEICPDHIHMLVCIPPKYSVSSFMGYLKGKSSLMIYEKWGNLKFRYGNKNFWCRGYYVDTAGKNSKKIAEYIQNQLKTDQLENPLPFQDGLEEGIRKRYELWRLDFQRTSSLGQGPHMKNPRLRRGIFISPAPEKTCYNKNKENFL